MTFQRATATELEAMAKTGDIPGLEANLLYIRGKMKEWKQEAEGYDDLPGCQGIAEAAYEEYWSWRQEADEVEELIEAARKGINHA